MNNKNKIVHVVFKTHLDIGFTDYAKNIIDKYFDFYIPQALKLSEVLRNADSKERFIWTVGSWLIYEYLEKASPANKQLMEKAILKGDVSWHALPFTTHTELMDKSLFKAGLALSTRLDARFGTKTIAAKMTDVPGHCRAIIPLLAEAGVKFLHIGINPASSPVKVPPFFRWQSPDGSEIIVNYNSGYGSPGVIDGFNDVLCFGHTGDNCGPPAQNDIIKFFNKLEDEYPKKTIKASSLNSFTERMLQYKDVLPVITGEMGDTWIHGIGSDPLKVAQFRQLCRLRLKWESIYPSDPGSEFDNFTRKLLLIPEHTWGMDEKTHLKDYVNYSKIDFDKARDLDIVSSSANEAKFNTFQMEDNVVSQTNSITAKTSYRQFEKSWKEQRNYIQESINCLKSPTLLDAANSALDELIPKQYNLDEFTQLPTDKEYALKYFKVIFDQNTGGMVSLIDRQSGKQWRAPNGAIGRFAYEIFSDKNYQDFYKNYCVNRKTTRFWSEPDFTKPGLDKLTQLKYRMIYMSPLAFYQKETDTHTEIIVLHKASDYDIENYGITEKLSIKYSFSNEQKNIDFELQWFNKNACRLPEASWMQFELNTDEPENWYLDKMGERISPYEVIKKGNQALHAIHSGAGYEGKDGCFFISSQDAPLISPGHPRILEADTKKPDLREGVHFNLHNNLWGTNFPMWYEDDAKFRFCLTCL